MVAEVTVAVAPAPVTAMAVLTVVAVVRRWLWASPRRVGYLTAVWPVVALTVTVRLAVTGVRPAGTAKVGTAGTAGVCLAGMARHPMAMKLWPVGTAGRPMATAAAVTTGVAAATVTDALMVWTPPHK